MDLKLHDVVELKKEHPCGSRRWEVLRVGMGHPPAVRRMRPRGAGPPAKGGKEHQACDTEGGNPMKNRKWTQYVAMGVALLMAIVMLLGLIIPYVGL